MTESIEEIYKQRIKTLESLLYTETHELKNIIVKQERDIDVLTEKIKFFEDLCGSSYDELIKNNKTHFKYRSNNYGK